MADAADLRLRTENEAPVRAGRSYVLYWMVEARRTRWNRALTRAVTLARSLGRPLLVLEALRCDYRYASARFHRFVLDGMADQTARFEAAGVAYFPYVEPVPGAGKALLSALAEHACAVVTDASPVSFLPRMRAAAAKRLDVRVEAVDGSGLLPRAAIRDALDDPFAFLKRFRRALPPLAFQGVEADPLEKPPTRRLERLPKDVADRWHPTRKALLDGDAEILARFPIDGSVAPSPLRGGEQAARAAWAESLRAPAASFAPDLDAWVHFGHLSVEEVAHDLLLREGCIASADLKKDDEKIEGWWRVSPAADRFLDRIVVRREHALHRAERRGRDADRYESLPGELRRTLETEAARPGRVVADLVALEMGDGPDGRWNALERRLRVEGRLPVGERRRWAGGLLDAAPTPRDAYDLAIHLTNKYALDGRDPFALAEALSIYRSTPPPKSVAQPRGATAPKAGRGPRGARPPKGARRLDGERRPDGERGPRLDPAGGPAGESEAGGAARRAARRRTGPASRAGPASRSRPEAGRRTGVAP